MRTILVPLIVLIAVLSGGCAFYEKKFVSRVALEGTNHRPRIYDEGVFYINAEPPIRIRMGCSASTTMLETMSLLVPFPFGRETPPHESIAGEPLSLTLRHEDRAEIDLSMLAIEVEIGQRVYPLKLVRKAEVRYDWDLEYEFAADLSCGEVRDGLLSIELDQDTVRTYGVNFEEGVRREFAWHPTFVT